MAVTYTEMYISFLAPYKTKVFSQCWYPIQRIGPIKNANEHLAVNLERTKEGWRMGVGSSEYLDRLTVRLTKQDAVVWKGEVDVEPGKPFVESVAAEQNAHESELRLAVLDKDGIDLICFCFIPEKAREEKLPNPATEPARPVDIETNEELYLTGLHLEQYRHATRAPEPYWLALSYQAKSDEAYESLLGTQQRIN